MEKLVENLVFDEVFPPNTSECHFFFSTPVFATLKALETYGLTTILACVNYLRDRARQYNGLFPAQSFFDPSGRRPAIWFQAENEEGVIGVGAEKNGVRTVVMLPGEYRSYQDGKTKATKVKE